MYVRHERGDLLFKAMEPGFEGVETFLVVSVIAIIIVGASILAISFTSLRLGVVIGRRRRILRVVRYVVF